MYVGNHIVWGAALAAVGARLCLLRLHKSAHAPYKGGFTLAT